LAKERSKKQKAPDMRPGVSLSFAMQSREQYCCVAANGKQERRPDGSCEFRFQDQRLLKLTAAERQPVNLGGE
jgi:hypothetical protein